MKPRIMYIETKADGLSGPARIGRVMFSQSGKTIYYRGQGFRSLRHGYKANFYCVETGEHYWISGCKKEGGDRLYGSTAVEIDADVREEYWTEIRKMPERAAQSSSRNLGKHRY